MRVVLTGGIATGKSRVLDRFAAHGVPTSDADRWAHDAIAPGGPAWQDVRDRFGPEVIDAEGRVDRRRLGAVVFADDAARADLNAIVHPRVRAAISGWFDESERRPGHRFGVVAIPLFFESPRTESFDRVIVTACGRAAQVARVVARGFSRDEAERRITAQLPTDEKVRRADHVIRTDGTLADTDRQVDALYRELAALSAA
jgi:dephospho-CoA kinase